MDDRELARDVGGIMSFVVPLIWKSKWLIGGASVVVAAVVFALVQASSLQIWSGRTTLTIGMVPSLNYLLFDGQPPLEPIEPARAVVARISDAGFRAEMLNKAAFEPATAALSRSLVASSLRGIVLEGDRDVAIELSAASPADVEAALRALAAEIVKVHGHVLDQRMQLLQQRMQKANSRMAEIEKSSGQLMDRIFKESGEEAKPQPSVFTAIPAWNALQDSIQRDANLKQLIEPSVLHLEPGTYIEGPRSVAALRASILAGLAMLLAMIVLTVVVRARSRPSAA